MERIFSLSGLLVLPIWAAMILLPRWRVTARVVGSPFVSVLPALLYAVLIAPVIGDVFPVVLNPTLPSVAALLGSPAGATIAWAHFLAFDLFVGRWIYLDARLRKVPALVVSVILFFTLMIGPVGYLAYLAVRTARGAGLAAKAREGAKALDRSSAALWRTAVGFGLLWVVLLAMTLVDHRTILGVDPWIKPSKFAISIAIYLATAAWLVGALRLTLRQRRFVEVSLVATMVIEEACIALQAARGTTSHFNQATAFDAVVFAVMGVTIGYASLVATYLLAKSLKRIEGLSPEVLWGIRMGLAIFLFASAVGGYMVGNNGHTVGAADGGPGLPYVNWSTAAGDLRVAHFLGLHALQALPVAGWFMRGRLGWTVAAGVGYAAAVVGLFALAVMGLPLLRA